MDRFSVPGELLKRTEKTLRTAGRNGDELFVLWSGKQRGRIFVVEDGHVPEQTAYKTPDGLCVEVRGAELHRLNAWLYEASQVLAIQIHCHPTDAYHSDTDDRFPIVTTIGGASIVVPEFCRDGIMTDGTAIYRLDSIGWTRSPGRARDLIQVV